MNIKGMNSIICPKKLSFNLSKWSLYFLKSGKQIGTYKVIIKKSRREVSPVEQYKIDREYLVYFEPTKFYNQIPIMQLFSVDATMFLPKKTQKNTLKSASEAAQIFFCSIANQPKTSPNHIFCSLKRFLCATSM